MTAPAVPIGSFSKASRFPRRNAPRPQRFPDVREHSRRPGRYARCRRRPVSGLRTPRRARPATAAAAWAVVVVSGRSGCPPLPPVSPPALPWTYQSPRSKTLITLRSFLAPMASEDRPALAAQEMCDRPYVRSREGLEVGHALGYDQIGPLERLPERLWPPFQVQTDREHAGGKAFVQHLVRGR